MATKLTKKTYERELERMQEELVQLQEAVRADGLRVFPGPVAGGVAAPFLVPATVDRETVWAALDCPGGWSVISPGRPYVLGRMAAVVSALPAPGDECVVVGTCEELDGRKAAVRTAIYSPDGGLLAHARATWIAI